MTAMQTLGTKLAAVPERALAAMPDLSAYSLRPTRRSWAAGEAVAAFGLGLAVGVALGLLLSGPAADEDADAVPIDDPGA
jgi:hypothetical protein